MRKTLALGVFVFGVILAACGGGGRSGIVPAAPVNPAPVQTPTSAKSTKATVVLHIPAASVQQARTKRPFYISSSTQSVGILVAPAEAPNVTPSPLPTAQVFPVSTPSPCASAAAGGETCTFTVVAPVGSDFFVVSTYATAGPNASTVPLSLVEGEATVSLNPNPSASPLAFSLNAIVATVTISVPSPDPSNTPNTQVFTAGVPAAPMPLTIMAKDANGSTILSDPTTTLGNAVAITVSPPPNAAGASGIEVGLNSQCGTNSTTGVAVAITCAADFNNVTLSYTGTTGIDANSHIIDNVEIVPVAAFLSTPGPAPAHVVLQSNVISYPIPNPFSGAGCCPQAGLLQPLSNGTVAYLAYSGSGAWGVGTFAPTTGTLAAPTVYAGSATVDPYTFAITTDLTSVWTTDTLTGQLFCWPGIAALSGTGAPISVQPDSINGPIDVVATTIDAQGNLWYVGNDSTTQQFAGFFATSANCGFPASPPTAQVTLTGDTSDYSNNIGTFQNGIAYNSQNHGVYVASTLSTAVSAVPPILAGASNRGGVGLANNATVYAAFDNGSIGDIETLTSPYTGPFTTLATLVPTAPFNGEGAFPQSVSVFSNTSGSADRIAYAEDGFGALGYIEGIQSVPQQGLMGLPHANNVYQTAFAQDGTALIMYEDSGGNLYLAHVLPTATWNVPVSAIADPCNGGLLTLVQRGTSSGPFTFSVNGAGVTTTALGGTTAAIGLSVNSNFAGTVTVTDASGRARTYPLTISGPSC